MLQTINRSIQILLGQDQADGESDDGLEMGICLINAERTVMRFAGGRFSLFSVNNGEVNELKGTKSGLGYRNISQDQAFDEVEIDLKKDTVYYMTSDGLLDQVGGERGRMLGKKKFEELLLSVQGMAMSKQKEAIYQALLNYQGAENRRDDVTVMGFRI